MSVQLPTLRCDASIMPDFANIQNFGRQLGSLPGTLERMAYCMVAEKAAQLRAAVKRIVDLFNKIFKGFPWSIPNPVFKNLEAIELEMELRLTALYNEFKLFWQNLVINILAKIPGLGFILNLLKIPIPFLGGPTLADIFTEAGRARIRAAIAKRLDAIAKALGMPWDLTWSGNLTLKNLEVQLQNIFTRVMQMVQQMISNIIQSALNLLTKLTKVIEIIWDALKLPRIPNLLAFDLAGLFKGIWDRLGKLAISIQERIRRTIDAILNFDLKQWLQKSFGALFNFIPWPFPTIIKKLLDALGNILDLEFNLITLEQKLQRIMSAVQQLVTNILNIVMELWLKLVTGFLKAIVQFFPIINQLLKLIPFTFCTFLNLVAAPLFSLPSQVAKIIPSSVSVTQPPPALPSPAPTT